MAQLGKVLFPGDPALRTALRMPQAVDYEGLTTAALAMAARADEHRERFVNAGLGEDFVERVQKIVAQIRATLNLREVHAGERAEATEGMLAEEVRGRSIVRVLDTMVAPRLKAEPEKLARWLTLVRFAQPGEAAAPEPETPPPVEPVTPPPVTPGAPVTGDGPNEERSRAA